MASSYDNDLRLNEQGTGDNSGSWGTVTNLNLEMIAEAFSYGTRVIANASSDTITLADGALDADRSMYLRLSGGGQACTVSLLPNTVSKVWMIENATSATLTFTQGSGANVAVLAGQVKMIATDGAGSGAVVYDLLTDVNLAGTTVTDIITSNQATVDDIDLNGKVITMTGSAGDTATITVAADGALAIATTDAAAAAANISITADGTFTATGTTVTLTSSGALSAAGTTITLDSAGDIILDADGADVIFKDGGTAIGTITNASSDLVIKSNVQDKDILLKGDDGASEITALTLDMSEAGAATFNSTVTRALTRGSIDVGNSSGVSAPLAKGSAGTFLTSDGTDLSFAAVSAGYDQVTFPSDWTSPDETFNSSGTYTKPSGVADDDYIWIYLIGGGGPGCSSGRANGSRAGNTAGYVGGSAGGGATLLYGKAKFFTGGAMVVGAAYPFSAIPSGTTFYYDSNIAGNPSTFTLTSSNGSVAYSTNNGGSPSTDNVNSRVIQVDGAGSVSDDYLHSQVASPTIFSLDTATTAVAAANAFEMPNLSSGNGVSTTQQTSVFAGGNAGARPYNFGALPTILQGTSILAGAGGILNGTDGQFPGGAGRSVTGTGVGGDGAAGQIRIYHV